MNIDEHPIYKEIYELCQAIEQLPPSKQATKCVVMAYALTPAVEAIVEETLKRHNQRREYARNHPTT